MTQFLRDQASDREEVVTPLMQARDSSEDKSMLDRESYLKDSNKRKENEHTAAVSHP